MENNFRFFFFQYGKEIRTFLITTFILGGVASGKAKFDQWQANRCDSWATTQATILDVEIKERMPGQDFAPHRLYRAQLTVEYAYQGEWHRGEAMVNAVPPSRLPMIGQGRNGTIRISTEEDPAPAFRWTDQEITSPRG